MITPNKFISFDQSVLAKLPAMYVGSKSIGIRDLYSKVSSVFESVDEFMYALDVLYVLNRINVDFDLRVVNYVD
ncbi:ABC-three component system middle component 7 [Burkholderia cenocepacia]|uniref:ABC-three component system middle component 7 n=1 Tax=Burkholderia cenocepacia TaxID=95486 RepID=UPI003D7699F8